MRKLNPTLPPDLIVLQIAPGNDLSGFGKYGFDFHPLNRIGGQLRWDDLADQKVLLLGLRLHRRPFGQLQLFGVQGIHGFEVYVLASLAKDCNLKT